MAKASVQTRLVSLSDLVPDPNNARVHDERSRDALAKSVGTLGAARSVVVDKDGVVRAGNGTLEAARAAGITEAIVLETDGKQLVVVKRPDWTEEQALAYAIADNRTGELSHFDPSALQATIEALAESAVDRDMLALVEAVGFDENELKVILDLSEDNAPLGEIQAGAKQPRLDQTNAQMWSVELNELQFLEVEKAIGKARSGDMTLADALMSICAFFNAQT